MYRSYNDSLPNPHLCLSQQDGAIIHFKTIQASFYMYDLSNIESYLIQTCPLCHLPWHMWLTSIRFQTKNVMVWNETFHQCMSANCTQWHVPNVKQAQGSSGFNCCKLCKQLINDIHWLQQNCVKVTTPTCMNHLSVSCNFPISKLSPASQAIHRGSYRGTEAVHE